MKLNLGCGSTEHGKDFINLDWNLQSVDNFVQANALHLPFKNNTFSGITAHHVLEHFTYYEAQEVLQECYRVLIYLGTMNIVVPCASYWMKHYLDAHDVERLSVELYGTWGETKYKGQHHKFAWDYCTLKPILTDLGFSVVNASINTSINLNVEKTE